MARDGGVVNRSAERSLDLAVGTVCNNGCRGCLWTRRLAFARHVDDNQPHQGSIRLAGREPTARPDLCDVIRSLHVRGATHVEVETNGRLLTYPRVVQQLREAGLGRLSIKLFANAAPVWDAHTRVPESFAQTMHGIEVVRREAPAVELCAILVPRRERGASLSELVEFAARLGFRAARVEMRLVKLDLTRLPELAAETRALRHSPPAGIQLEWARGS